MMHSNPRLASNPKWLWLIAFIVGCLAMSLFVRNAASQNRSTAAPLPGRYQLVAPNENIQIVIDTQTGQTWYKYGAGAAAKWEAQPPLPKP